MFPRYIASLAGALAAVVTFVIALIAGTSALPWILLILLIGNVGAYLFAALVVSMLFFFYTGKIFKTAAWGVPVFNAVISGAFLAWAGLAALITRWAGAGTAGVVGLLELALGIFLIALGSWWVLRLYKRYDRIGIFTDGVKIGNISLKYEDIIEVNFGTQKPIENKIPESGKGKPIEILTPIEYEYVEKDFGIYHVYMIVVTTDKVYVAQSLNRQSNLAQDTMNAWGRFHGLEVD